MIGLVFVLWSFVGDRVSSETMDAEIMRKRLLTTYGEFGSAQTSDWDVARQGETETWTWNGKAFSCPHPEVWNCQDWTPTSFRWWMAKEEWLGPWVQMKKQNYLLDKEKPQASTKPSQVEATLSAANEDREDAVVEVPPAELGDDEEDPILLRGKRLALEKWLWTNSSGERINVYTSLRNDWIERIDSSNKVEYIEWDQKNKWSKPYITKVMLERDGVRASFQRKAPAPKKK
ncbi:MAG: hypothetical protein COV44_03360 [Deltaproteobacteria bacterium CG11_big_fil_rev_8_21_14_0_20_45_16]|nr:MAG: hypothetical protein COV44_03360 [Deltaproteobacteria bacterium CG11_big_fil_rev_8_21_14_0_20_45_16]